MSSSSVRARKARPILVAIAIVCAVLVFDRALAAGLYQIMLRSDDRIARIYAGGRSDDVVIVGGSVANAMANPVQLSAVANVDVFMMAVHGLDARTQLALLEDYLAANAPPRVGVLEIRAARARLVRAREFSPYARPGTHVAALLRASQDSIVPWRAVFHLYRFNSPLLPKTVQNIVDRDDQASGASNGVMTAAIAQAWVRHSASGPLDAAQVRAYVGAIESLRRAGSAPVVVVAPLHPAARGQNREVMARIVEAAPADTMICDFSDYLNEDRFYEDPAHLNAAGRAAVEPMFAAMIAMARNAATAPEAARDAAWAEALRRCRTAALRRAA